MSDKYILDGHKPVPADLMGWARWFETADRHVAQNNIGALRVSTVFLGLDHSFGEGPPLLFETMIFGLEGDKYQTRCSTWEEAEEMHAKALAIARAAVSEEANNATP